MNKAPFASLKSYWIWSSERSHEIAEDRSPSHYEVRRFRRSFNCSNPDSLELKVHVSADSRYIFFCNGQRIGRGPGKGDLRHHFYETYDLTSFLQKGENVLSALVMDYSKVATRPASLGAPTSVMTYAGGFVLEGALLENGDERVDLSTNEEWKVQVDKSYRFQNDKTTFEGFIGYFEEVYRELEPVSWKEAGYDEVEWKNASNVYAAESYESRRDPKSPYGLMARMIPMLEEEKEESFIDVFVQGGKEAPAGWDEFIKEGSPLTIEPHSKVEVILDAGGPTTAFPMLAVSGGKGTEVRMQYAEALRLDWETEDAVLMGKKQSLANLASEFSDESSTWTYDRRGWMTGWQDKYHLAGADDLIETFHWRMFRYVGLTIETGAESLTIRSFNHRFTAYPYKVTGYFRSSDASHERFWDMSVKTMRLCSHETFEDGPYYEQMQYAGDTRITSKIGMLTTGDYRLSRQALYQFDWSRVSDGLTHSRYPSRYMQIIPSWSLHWVSNIRDYFVISGDRETTIDLLPGIRSVVDWFRRHIGARGLPEDMEYWNTTEWCPDWQRGNPPGWDEGPTCVISCHYLQGLDDLMWLEEQVGDKRWVSLLKEEGEEVRAHVRDLFWSEKEGLFTDRPGGPEISQYGNAWAVITDVPTEDQKQILVKRFPHDEKLSQASFFGVHYLFEASKKLGMYQRDFAKLIAPWHFMEGFGLQTWAEETSFWRGLCHAWSAHPLLEFVGTFLGIEPTAPGFDEVLISPQPCGLNHAEGKICTPKGDLAVSWKIEGETFRADVTIPDGVKAVLQAPNGESVEVLPGASSHSFSLE
jgi:alpha-L-rhamnosidase